MTVTRVIAAIYALLGLAAVSLIPASAYGWFGLPQDALAGVYAIVLAMPWSLLLRFAPVHGSLFAAALIVLCMIANVLVILMIGRLLRRPGFPAAD